MDGKLFTISLTIINVRDTQTCTILCIACEYLTSYTQNIQPKNTRRFRKPADILKVALIALLKRLRRAVFYKWVWGRLNNTTIYNGVIADLQQKIHERESLRLSDILHRQLGLFCFLTRTNFCTRGQNSPEYRSTVTATDPQWLTAHWSLCASIKNLKRKWQFRSFPYTEHRDIFF